MIDNPFEAESFANITSALGINLGTPTPDQMQAMKISAETVSKKSIPWVLDPVGYGAILKWRKRYGEHFSQLKTNGYTLKCF